MSIVSAGLCLAELADSFPQRFEARCSKPNDAGCIEWLGPKTLRGYGSVYIRMDEGRRKKTTAHRVAWVLKRGDLSPEILVLHRCDNPRCVNVEHLFLGSPADNTRDMMTKGRHGWRNGYSWQKLCAVDGERVRDLRRAGCTQQQIADWLGVSRPLISMIENGKIKHSQLAIC